MQQNSTPDLQRFGGIARLYGQESLVTLAQSHIAVVGIGGVGSWAAEALARSGVGCITLIDLDEICVTNTNRQIHALQGQVGRSKVAVMAERLRLINPALVVHEVEDFLTAETAQTYLHGELDGVIDCIDSAGNKAQLIAHCKRNKLLVITTGAAGGQIDPTQIRVTDLNRTQNDPLARKVRGILRRHYGYARDSKKHYSVPCVYSTEQLRYPKPDGSVCQQKQTMTEGVRLDCSGGFGASMMVTASFGLTAVSTLIDRLLKRRQAQQAAALAN